MSVSNSCKIASGIFLLLRSLVWTLLIPGLVTVYFPYRIIDGATATLPESWGTAQFLGMIPTAIGIAILLHCIWTFAVVGRGTLSPIDAPRKLVATGLYRFVRNPMYVGVVMILLGEALFFESLELGGYTFGFFVIINVVIVLIEEPLLRRQFGSSYQRYCHQVGRWIPDIKGYTAMKDQKKVVLQTLNELKSFIPKLAIRNENISQWTIGMQIQHCLISTRGICNALVDSDPLYEKPRKSLIRRIVFLTGVIPRGRGRSPKAALPSEGTSATRLNELLAEARQAVHEAARGDGNCWWEHFMFGVMTRDEALKFVAIHNKHHLRIVRDIVSGLEMQAQQEI